MLGDQLRSLSRQQRTFLLVTACLAGLLVGTLGEENASAQSSGPIRLQTGHGEFLDNEGRVVILHGVDISDKCSTSGVVVSSGGGGGLTEGCPATYSVEAQYPNSDRELTGFTDKDAQFLANNGLDAVRLGVNFSDLVPTRPPVPGQFTVNQAYLDQIVRVAQLLANHGIWFYLDMHEDCFEEWPAWAVPWDKADGQPPQAGGGDLPPFPVCQMAPSPISRAYDNLFKYPVDPDNSALPGGSRAVIPVSEVWLDYRQAWEQLAARFRGMNYLLGYDIMNEPVAGSTALSCFNLVIGCTSFEEHIQAFYEYVLQGIRQLDPVNSPAATRRAGIVLPEPNPLNGSVGAPSGLGDVPFTDPKVAWNFHNYVCLPWAYTEPAIQRVEPSELPDPAVSACDNSQQTVWDGTDGVGGAIRNAAHLTGADINTATGKSRVAGAQPAPLLMSEFSPTGESEVEAAEQNFTSWTAWAYQTGPGEESAVFDSEADQECVCLTTSQKASLLIRPYPQATAGTPKSFDNDPASKAVTFTYKPFDTTTQTVIFVPQLWAPKGYRVTVTNGEVLSHPDATHLNVTADQASRALVTVVLTPLAN